MHPCELENSALAEGLVGTEKRVLVEKPGAYSTNGKKLKGERGDSGKGKKIRSRKKRRK